MSPGVKGWVLIMEYMSIQYTRDLGSFDNANYQREYLVKRAENKLPRRKQRGIN